jgi:hypothetical protein
MDVTRPFFQQLSGRFSLIALLSFLLVSVITSFLVIRDNQVTQLVEKELPLLVKKSNSQPLILATYLTLDNLAKRGNAKDLVVDYQKAQQQINEISVLVNKKALLDLMYVGHKEFAGIIDKLGKNHDRNNQLKQSTIIQLQLLNDQLTSEIKDKTQQSSFLFQQINSDKLTDKVTAARAKTYTKQLTKLTKLQQLQHTLIRALLAFQQLNLQSSILNFDDISAELKQILTAFLVETALEKSVMNTQLITLEQLLFSQQNTVAKWRSQLRLSRSYIKFIQQQQHKLQQLVNKNSPVKPALQLLLTDLIPLEMNHWLDREKFVINHQHLQLAGIILIFICYLLLLGMIFKTKNRIKTYGFESIQLFTQLISCFTHKDGDKITADTLNSAENIKIAQLVQRVLETMMKPEHSETEFQQQFEEKKLSTEIISQQTNEIEEQQENIKRLTLINTEQNHQKQFHDSAINEKLSNMVVRTMLQSQSVSIGSGVTSVQVYRQLTRIFEWCRQSGMRDKFLSATQTLTLNDVVLHHEIDAALLNIISDAHFQRNQIFYQQDEQLLTHAKLDARLFHRLLTGVCRLSLTDLFKASLHINTRVVDKNEGQQIVRFDFSVTSKKKIIKLPELMARLLSVEQQEGVAKITENDTFTYLFLLLEALHVEDRSAQLQDNGYQFSFTLPIAFADVAHENVVDEVDLKQAKFLLVSNNNNILIATKKAIESANGTLEQLAEIEHIVDRLTINSLAENKLDMVILGSDFYLASLNNMQQQIASLSENLRPKLFIMQPHYTAPLHRHGLFEQAANPLHISKFKLALHRMLTIDKSSNILLNANTFIKHQYLPTQVEVLLAVENPTAHQPLLRILQWLGLQVHVVCQSQAMIKFWCSGRYLLLFTEFAESPCIELSAGKGVRRGVFTFRENRFSAQSSQKQAEKWLFSVVPTLKEVDDLVKLLQPWLKAKCSNIVPIEKVVEQGNAVEINQISTVQSVKTGEASLQTVLALDSATTIPDNQIPVFNLAKYASNQGSAELAVVMLDDYLADINQAMEELSQEVNEQKYSQGINSLEGLIKTSSILAAQAFTDACQVLKNELIISVPGTKNKHLLKILSELTLQQKLLNKFAEAI